LCYSAVRRRRFLLFGFLQRSRRTPCDRRDGPRIEPKFPPTDFARRHRRQRSERHPPERSGIGPSLPFGLIGDTRGIILFRKSSRRSGQLFPFRRSTPFSNRCPRGRRLQSATWTASSRPSTTRPKRPPRRP